MTSPVTVWKEIVLSTGWTRKPTLGRVGWPASGHVAGQGRAETQSESSDSNAGSLHYTAHPLSVSASGSLGASSCLKSNGTLEAKDAPPGQPVLSVHSLVTGIFNLGTFYPCFNTLTPFPGTSSYRGERAFSQSGSPYGTGLEMPSTPCTPEVPGSGGFMFGGRLSWNVNISLGVDIREFQISV